MIFRNRVLSGKYPKLRVKHWVRRGQRENVEFFGENKSLKVINAPEGALTPNLKNVEVTVQTNYSVVENSPDRIQVWKSTQSNYSKTMMPRVMVLVHCTFPQWDLSAYEIHEVSSLNTFWVMFRTKFYLPMKFHVDVLHSFKIMLRTKKDGRTDGLTEGRTISSRLLYATLRGYKNPII